MLNVPAYDKSQRLHLTWATRRATERGERLELASDNLRQLADSVREPHPPPRKLDEFVVVLADRTRGFGKAVDLDASTDWPLIYAQSKQEFEVLRQALVDDYKWATASTAGLTLTMAGWNRHGQLPSVDPPAPTPEGAPSPGTAAPQAGKAPMAGTTDGAAEVNPAPRLFISHSSADATIAEALVRLLRSALGLPPDAIRCTSVAGSRLPAGASTNEQIREEVLTCVVLVGIISPTSLGSLYVAFELGARWGSRKNLIPLLAKGLPPSAMKGPLGGINALRADDSNQLHQLINDVGRLLGMTPHEPASYGNDLKAVREAAASIEVSPEVVEPAPQTPPRTEQRRADVRVTLESRGGDHKFFIRNLGDGSAQDVSFRLNLGPNAESPLVKNDYEEKIPIAELAPGGECPLSAAFAFGMPTSFQAEWSWRNEDGSRETRRSVLGL